MRVLCVRAKSPAPSPELLCTQIARQTCGPMSSYIKKHQKHLGNTFLRLSDQNGKFWKIAISGHKWTLKPKQMCHKN